MPLLEGLDGVLKMSQSLNNYVALREQPEEMFGKLMSIPDELTARYASLAANLEAEELAEIEASARAGGPEAGEAKRRMARAVVALYRGEEAAATAETAFDKQFVERGVPADIPVASIPADAIDGERVYLPRVLAELDLASSRSDARRLIEQGGVKINGDPTSAEEVTLAELDGAVLQVGKRRFVRLQA